MRPSPPLSPVRRRPPLSPVPHHSPSPLTNHAERKDKGRRWVDDHLLHDLHADEDEREGDRPQAPHPPLPPPRLCIAGGLPPYVARSLLSAHQAHRSPLLAQFADPLLRKFNLVTFDMRGHGETGSKLEGQFTRVEGADDVIKFMVSAGPDLYLRPTCASRLWLRRDVRLAHCRLRVRLKSLRVQQ